MAIDFEAEARALIDGWRETPGLSDTLHVDERDLADFARRMYEAGYRSRDGSVGALSQAHRDFRTELLALAERWEASLALSDHARAAELRAVLEGNPSPAPTDTEKP